MTDAHNSRMRCSCRSKASTYQHSKQTSANFSIVDIFDSIVQRGACKHQQHYANQSTLLHLLHTTRSIWKMLGPFATASRYIAIHQVSLLSHDATVAHRLRIDVHNDDDNNNDDNVWQRGPLWPHRMGPITTVTSCDTDPPASHKDYLTSFSQHNAPHTALTWTLETQIIIIIVVEFCQIGSLSAHFTWHSIAGNEN